MILRFGKSVEQALWQPLMSASHVSIDAMRKVLAFQVSPYFYDDLNAVNYDENDPESWKREREIYLVGYSIFMTDENGKPKYFANTADRNDPLFNTTRFDSRHFEADVNGYGAPWFNFNWPIPNGKTMNVYLIYHTRD